MCASVCVRGSAAFGAQSLKDRASERNASEARSSDSVRSTGLSSVRPQPDGTRERNASGSKPPTKRQPVINQASTGHQPSVNGTSTGHQRNVNGTSNRRFSRRETTEIHFGGHQRNTQSGLVDQNAVSRYAGRADLSGLDHQHCGRETCRAARPAWQWGTGFDRCERNGAIGSQVGCVLAIAPAAGINGRCER